MSERVFDRFSVALEHLIADSSIQAIAVAVSGGSDSMALSLLLKQWCDLRPIKLCAFTVDHGLRKESADEALRVHQWMLARGIEHEILHWNRPTVGNGNLQADAREARYELLREACQAKKIPFICIGHTQDDQAETIALREQRQSGPYGQAGMSAKRKLSGQVQILRPLLDCRRDALRRFLASEGVSWIDDPSNENEKFDRIAVRRRLQGDESERQRLLAQAKECGKWRQEFERECNRWFALACDSIGEDGAQIKKDALRAGREELVCFAIGELIRRMGGQDYAPRYRKLQMLCHALIENEAGKRSLGHCDIRWNRERILVAPDGQRDGSKNLIDRNSLVADPFYLI